MASDSLETRAYRPGEIIFSQGDTGDDAFIVESGQIEIASGNGNAEIVIATIDEGGLFGEMALIDDAPRMATARAMKKTKCVVVPKRVFGRLMKDAHPVLRVILGTMMQRVRGKASKTVGSTIG